MKRILNFLRETSGLIMGLAMWLPQIIVPPLFSLFMLGVLAVSPLLAWITLPGNLGPWLGLAFLANVAKVLLALLLTLMCWGILLFVILDCDWKAAAKGWWKDVIDPLHDIG